MDMVLDGKCRRMIVGGIKIIIFVNVHSCPNQIITVSPFTGSTQFILQHFLLLSSARLRDYPLHYTNLRQKPRETPIYTKNEVIVIALLRSFYKVLIIL